MDVTSDEDLRPRLAPRRAHLGNGDLGVSVGALPERGALTLFLGLNQLVALRDYNGSGARKLGHRHRVG